MAKISNLQLTKTKWHSGLTMQNHLASVYATQPEVMDTLITRIFALNTAPMQYLTSGMKRKKELGNREFQWYLKGDSERAVKIVANLEAAGNTTPGKYGAFFRIAVEDDDFAQGDVVAFDDRAYRARVMEQPFFNGQGFELVLKMNTYDQTAYVPVYLLLAGRELNKEYNTQSEISEHGSKTVFSHPFTLRNHMTTVRKDYSVTRAAATDVMVVKYSDPKNPSNTTEMWCRAAEWEFMYQWYRELETVAIYSTYSADQMGVTHMQDNSSLPVYEGAGLREQIASSNKRYYSELTEGIISDFLAELSYNTVPESDRKFVALTGEYGYREFHNALENKAGTWTLLKDNPFINGSGRNVSLGGQFTTYVGLNGIELTLAKMPIYDNTVINRQKHYQSGKPLESYRFTIFDFGMKGADSNITKVYKKGSEMIMWHVAGSIDPYGNPASGMRSNGKDGFTVYSLAEVGYMVKNPAACGELICNAAK